MLPCTPFGDQTPSPFTLRWRTSLSSHEERWSGGSPSARLLRRGDRTDREEAFKVLGLEPGSSKEAIEGAFLEQAKAVHPNAMTTDCHVMQLRYRVPHNRVRESGKTAFS